MSLGQLSPKVSLLPSQGFRGLNLEVKGPRRCVATWGMVCKWENLREVQAEGVREWFPQNGS